MNDALTVSRDTPGLAAASQSASGLSRFTLSTHSPSTESPFLSHASKLSSPSVMGVSGLSRINSPSLSRVNAPRFYYTFVTITHTCIGLTPQTPVVFFFLQAKLASSHLLSAH